jgi:hypothetical protein
VVRKRSGRTTGAERARFSLFLRNAIEPRLAADEVGDRMDEEAEAARRVSRRRSRAPRASVGGDHVRKFTVGGAFFDQFQIGFTVPLSTFVTLLQ